MPTKECVLPLVARQDVADGTMAFWFDTTATDFSFTAGQYADFTLIDPPQTDAEGNTRSFSLASPPSEKNRIMITTRMRDTAFKNVLKTMPLGTSVRVSAPMGSFTLHQNAERPAVFIVGGIGITPIHSIVLDALERDLPHQLYLFYSNRTPQTTTFLDEFESLAKDHQNFHFIPTITDLSTDLSAKGSPTAGALAKVDASDPAWKYEMGPINEEMMLRHLANKINVIAYIVGPPAMVSAMIPVVERVGIDPDNIRTEEFAGY